MIWKVFDSEFKNVAEINAHKNGILDICWSLDSAKMYSWSADKTVGVWDLIEGKRIKKYKDHEGIVNSVQAPKRGEQIFVTTSDDCTVRMFDERVKQAVEKIKLNYQSTTATFSDTNEYIFYGGVDNQIKAWNVKSEETNEFSLLGHSDTITGVSLSHDGRFLLSNAMDKNVKMWDISPFVVGGNRWLKTFYGGMHNFEKNLLRCAWNKDDSVVSAGSSDNFVYLWNVETGEVLEKLGGHHGSVNETAFHPEANIIASGSSDKTIFIGEFEK